MHYCDQALSVVRPSSVCPSVRRGKLFKLSTSPLRLLNGIPWILTWSKNSTSSSNFVFFEPIWKIKWPPRPLIGWDTFDFSSETAIRNWTKFDRKQDLTVLYPLFVFLCRSQNQDGCTSLLLAGTFSTSPLNRIQRNVTKSKNSKCPFPKMCFCADCITRMATLSFDWPMRRQDTPTYKKPH